MINDNYKINLPKTKFSMKANLPQREQNFYDQNISIYNSLIEKNKNKQKFILHDGPPYANGDLHMGHALNKILKDFIIRYKNMSGYSSPFIPGWDTHGLPIENNVIKKFGRKIQNSTLLFRNKCKEYALKNVNNQMLQFKKLNIFADYNNAYLTCDFEYEARQIDLFANMFEKKYIYKGVKPVYWCTNDKTALAEAEIEYSDKSCKSIYVKFELINSNEKLTQYDEKIFFIIWTTTPWTLLANVALAVNKDIYYSLIKNRINNEIYIIADELKNEFIINNGNNNYEILEKKFYGSYLEFMVAKNSITNNKSLIINSNHVNITTGTGIVHIAPGHGIDDYIACQKYNLPIHVCIDECGNIISEKYKNIKYYEINELLINNLKEKNMLVSIKDIMHSYPHCWRCNTPIVFRATEQWFCSIDKLRNDAINACNHINWIPKWGKNRMTKMLESRIDWCISRQRLWGVPIPIFYCKECKNIIYNKDLMNKIIDLFKKYGSDCWYYENFYELLNYNFYCNNCKTHNTTVIKENDIMDVWFDSGTSHLLLNDNNLQWPSDLCLEGNDQYRGWFQTSLLTSIAYKNKIPYKTILTHGWIIDDKGLKMSKSSGNGINPLDIINKYGTDILRLCIASMDFRSDLNLSETLLQQIMQSYTKIRNTARFILGNINNIFSKTINNKENNFIDKIILYKTNILIKEVKSHYDNYEFHSIFHKIYNFCTVELSNFYFDIVKDILYCDDIDSKRRINTQAILYYILCNIIKLLAPILPFTTQEVWNEIKNIENINYIMLSDFPEYNDNYELSIHEIEKSKFLLELREKINKKLELSRKDKNIGKSLEAYVILKMNEKNYNLIQDLNINEIFIISQSDVIIDHNLNDSEIDIVVIKTNLKKCNRCWIHSTEIINDLCIRCAKTLNDN